VLRIDARSAEDSAPYLTADNGQFMLIAGLGNPGREYARTRHNVGFMVVEQLAEKWRASWVKETKFRARVARVDRDQRKILLCAPETYMNTSGEAVGALTGFYRIERQNLAIIVDDADLPLGTIRMRPEGSSGGHHGLESVQQHLGTNEFPRLRIGIGRKDPADRQITDYVLSQFRSDEMELLGKVLTRVCEQIECWLAEGMLSAMNRFNGSVERGL
jgi:peptidyl-tRNA hydrolase, PTH1 family